MNPNIRAPTIRKGESCCVEEHVDDKKRDSNKVEPAELSGVVVNVGFNKYDVHVAETSEIFKMKKKWKLVKVQVLDQFDDMENALRLIEKNETPLRDVLFGLRTPSQKQETQNLVFKNPKLDKSQKEAVVSAVHQNELSVIHGPPGTGKTTTIAEIVWQVTDKIIYDFVISSLVQCVQAGEKVLVTAASNVAVDNLGERLLEDGINVVRVGHPARISEGLLSHSLRMMAEKEWDNLTNIKEQIEEAINALQSRQQNTPTAQLKEKLKKLKASRAKAAAQLDIVQSKIMRAAPVVLSTLTGCKDKGPLSLLPDDHFSTCIIDECAQSLEMACWMAVHKAPKLILAGDHQQLPPTVLTKDTEAEKMMKISMMERLSARYSYFGVKIFHMLNVSLSFVYDVLF